LEDAIVQKWTEIFPHTRELITASALLELITLVVLGTTLMVNFSTWFLVPFVMAILLRPSTMKIANLAVPAWNPLRAMREKNGMANWLGITFLSLFFHQVACLPPFIMVLWRLSRMTVYSQTEQEMTVQLAFEVVMSVGIKPTLLTLVRRNGLGFNQTVW
jgi:hypothetical protein